jgi:hypothetical protein
MLTNIQKAAIKPPREYRTRCRMQVRVLFLNDFQGGMIRFSCMVLRMNNDKKRWLGDLYVSHVLCKRHSNR